MSSPGNCHILCRRSPRCCIVSSGVVVIRSKYLVTGRPLQIFIEFRCLADGRAEIQSSPDMMTPPVALLGLPLATATPTEWGKFPCRNNFATKIKSWDLERIQHVQLVRNIHQFPDGLLKVSPFHRRGGERLSFHPQPHRFIECETGCWVAFASVCRPRRRFFRPQSTSGSCSGNSSWDLLLFVLVPASRSILPSPGWCRADLERSVPLNFYFQCFRTVERDINVTFPLPPPPLLGSRSHGEAIKLPYGTWLVISQILHKLGCGFCFILKSPPVEAGVGFLPTYSWIPRMHFPKSVGLIFHESPRAIKFKHVFDFQPSILFPVLQFKQKRVLVENQ